MSREMSLKLNCYSEARFGDFSDQDGTVRFFSRVNALLKPDFTVLDVGCGRGAYAEDPVRYRRDLRILQGKCSRVIGIDVDSAASDNPYIDHFRLIGDGAWPVDSNSIDLAVSDYVLEHVLDPDTFFAECARVLKVGGLLCLRTPNRLGYVAMVSRSIPNRLHAAVLKMIGKTRGAEDVFPTVYRCNTRGKIRRVMRRHGFDACVYGYEDEPTYLCFSRLAYTLGNWCRQVIPPMFRGNLFVFGRKLAGSRETVREVPAPVFTLSDPANRDVSRGRRRMLRKSSVDRALGLRDSAVPRDLPQPFERHFDIDQYAVALTAEERSRLEQLVCKNQAAASELLRAWILLLADESGSHTGRLDQQIAETLQLGSDTVFQVCKRFVAGGLEQALHPRRQPRHADRWAIDTRIQPQLVDPPRSGSHDGNGDWKVETLADRAVVTGRLDAIAWETIRKALEEIASKSES